MNHHQMSALFPPCVALVIIAALMTISLTFISSTSTAATIIDLNDIETTLIHLVTERLPLFFYMADDSNFPKEESVRHLTDEDLSTTRALLAFDYSTASESFKKQVPSVAAFEKLQSNAIVAATTSLAKLLVDTDRSPSETSSGATPPSIAQYQQFFSHYLPSPEFRREFLQQLLLSRTVSAVETLIPFFTSIIKSVGDNSAASYTDEVCFVLEKQQDQRTVTLLLNLPTHFFDLAPQKFLDAIVARLTDDLLHALKNTSPLSSASQHHNKDGNFQTKFQAVVKILAHRYHFSHKNTVDSHGGPFWRSVLNLSRSVLSHHRWISISSFAPLSSVLDSLMVSNDSSNNHHRHLPPSSALQTIFSQLVLEDAFFLDKKSELLREKLLLAIDSHSSVRSKCVLSERAIMRLVTSATRSRNRLFSVSELRLIKSTLESTLENVDSCFETGEDTTSSASPSEMAKNRLVSEMNNTVLTLSRSLPLLAALRETFPVDLRQVHRELTALEQPLIDFFDAPSNDASQEEEETTPPHKDNRSASSSSLQLTRDLIEEYFLFISSDEYAFQVKEYYNALSFEPLLCFLIDGHCHEELTVAQRLRLSRPLVASAVVSLPVDSLSPEVCNRTEPLLTNLIEAILSGIDIAKTVAVTRKMHSVCSPLKVAVEKFVETTLCPAICSDVLSAEKTPTTPRVTHHPHFQCSTGLLPEHGAQIRQEVQLFAGASTKEIENIKKKSPSLGCLLALDTNFLPASYKHWVRYLSDELPQVYEMNIAVDSVFSASSISSFVSDLLATSSSIETGNNNDNENFDELKPSAKEEFFTSPVLTFVHQHLLPKTQTENTWKMQGRTSENRMVLSFIVSHFLTVLEQNGTAQDADDKCSPSALSTIIAKKLDNTNHTIPPQLLAFVQADFLSSLFECTFDAHHQLFSLQHQQQDLTSSIEAASLLSSLVSSSPMRKQQPLWGWTPTALLLFLTTRKHHTQNFLSTAARIVAHEIPSEFFVSSSLRALNESANNGSLSRFVETSILPKSRPNAGPHSVPVLIEKLKSMNENALSSILADPAFTNELEETIICAESYPIDPRLSEEDLGNFAAVEFAADGDRHTTDSSSSSSLRSRCALLAHVRRIAQLSFPEFGGPPRSAQLLATLLLQNVSMTPKIRTGLLAEIATGEGKQLIIGMTAVMIRISRGAFIDIVTSSSELATKDAAKMSKKFYPAFGFETCSYRSDVIGSPCSEKADFLYGTAPQIASDALRAEYLRKRDSRGQRRYSVVIIDEVDSLFLDASSSEQATRLSESLPGYHFLSAIQMKIYVEYARELATLREDPETGALFQMFNLSLMNSTNQTEAALKRAAAAAENETTTDDDDGKQVQLGEAEINTSTDHWVILVEERFVNSTRELITDDDKSPFLIPPHLRNTVLRLLPRWVKSFSEAFFRSRINRDYVLAPARYSSSSNTTRGPTVAPIDPDTGTTMLNTEWDYWLHQAVSLKHHLHLSDTTPTVSYLFSTELFRRYKTIIGLSGTIAPGDEEGAASSLLAEKSVLKNIFNVSTLLQVPSFQDRRLAIYPPVIVDHHQNDFETNHQTHTTSIVENWWRKIADITQHELKNSGRAALLLFNTIEEALQFHSFLKKTTGITCREYLRSDPARFNRKSRREQDEDNKRPLGPGECLLATNIAGRGYDPVITREVETNGGLHVIVTFVPSNSRVLRQAYGRAARAGAPGSGQLVAVDDHSSSKITSDTKNMTQKYHQLTNRTWSEYARQISSFEKSRFPAISGQQLIFSKFCDLVNSQRKRQENGTAIQDDAILRMYAEAFGLFSIENRDKLDNLTSDDEALRLFKENFLAEYASALEDIEKVETDCFASSNQICKPLAGVVNYLTYQLRLKKLRTTHHRPLPPQNSNQMFGLSDSSPFFYVEKYWHCIESVNHNRLALAQHFCIQAVDAFEVLLGYQDEDCYIALMAAADEESPLYNQMLARKRVTTEMINYLSTAVKVIQKALSLPKYSIRLKNLKLMSDHFKDPLHGTSMNDVEGEDEDADDNSTINSTIPPFKSSRYNFERLICEEEWASDGISHFFEVELIPPPPPKKNIFGAIFRFVWSIVEIAVGVVIAITTGQVDLAADWIMRGINTFIDTIQRLRHGGSLDIGEFLKEKGMQYLKSILHNFANAAKQAALEVFKPVIDGAKQFFKPVTDALEKFQAKIGDSFQKINPFKSLQIASSSSPAVLKAAAKAIGHVSLRVGKHYLGKGLNWAVQKESRQALSHKMKDIAKKKVSDFLNKNENIELLEHLYLFERTHARHHSPRKKKSLIENLLRSVNGVVFGQIGKKESNLRKALNLVQGKVESFLDKKTNGYASLAKNLYSAGKTFIEFDDALSTVLSKVSEKWNEIVSTTEKRHHLLNRLVLDPSPHVLQQPNALDICEQQSSSVRLLASSTSPQTTAHQESYCECITASPTKESSDLPIINTRNVNSSSCFNYVRYKLIGNSTHGVFQSFLVERRNILEEMLTVSISEYATNMIMENFIAPLGSRLVRTLTNKITDFAVEKLAPNLDWSRVHEREELMKRNGVSEKRAANLKQKTVNERQSPKNNPQDPPPPPPADNSPPSSSAIEADASSFVDSKFEKQPKNDQNTIKQSKMAWDEADEPWNRIKKRFIKTFSFGSAKALFQYKNMDSWSSMTDISQDAVGIFDKVNSAKECFNSQALGKPTKADKKYACADLAYAATDGIAKGALSRYKLDYVIDVARIQGALEKGRAWDLAERMAVKQGGVPEDYLGVAIDVVYFN